MDMLTLASDLEELIPIAAIVGGCSIAVVSILISGIRGMIVGKAREESRREIAAYVAEGSISADDAAKLIAAGKPIGTRGCS